MVMKAYVREMAKIPKETMETRSFRFITPGQLSEMLCVSMAFVYEHTRKGSKDPIPGAFKFGKHIRFRRDEVEKWINAHEKKAHGNAGGNGRW